MSNSYSWGNGQVLLFDVFFIIIINLASVLSDRVSFNKHPINLLIAKSQEFSVGFSIDNGERKVAVGKEVRDSCHKASSIENTLIINKTVSEVFFEEVNGKKEYLPNDQSSLS